MRGLKETREDRIVNTDVPSIFRNYDRNEDDNAEEPHKALEVIFMSKSRKQVVEAETGLPSFFRLWLGS